MNLLGPDIAILSGNIPRTLNYIVKYKEAEVVIKSLKVVKDAAEHSFAS